MEFLEMLQKVVKGELPESPAARTIGFHVIEAEESRVVIEMNATERLHNPVGTLHGGILGDIADAAMGYAFATTLAKDELFSTVEMKVSFLKPIFKAKRSEERRVGKECRWKRWEDYAK